MTDLPQAIARLRVDAAKWNIGLRSDEIGIRRDDLAVLLDAFQEITEVVRKAEVILEGYQYGSSPEEGRLHRRFWEWLTRYDLLEPKETP